jgi:hypothetical protein
LPGSTVMRSNPGLGSIGDVYRWESATTANSKRGRPRAAIALPPAR